MMHAALVWRMARAFGVMSFVCTAACSAWAQGGGFDIGVSPSRFELSSKSAARLGQSLEVFNQSSTPTEVAVRTLDWEYSEKGEITFHDELRPGSCRPWFTLERRTLKIAAKAKAAFRFQIDVPADAEVGECRVMLAIEGVKPAFESMVQSGMASLSLPVNGRIAVAVYVAVNGAQPLLSMQQVRTTDGSAGKEIRTTVHNGGTAHGRLDGALDAKDAAGQRFELVPDGSPIMPGQTRVLPLRPRAQAAAGAPAVQMQFPVTASGTLDWEQGSFKVNAVFD